MKTFFDVTNIFTPDILINYERLEILEPSQNIIFYKGSNIGEIFLLDGNIYFKDVIKHIRPVQLIKAYGKKDGFNDAVNLALSFKKIRNNPYLSTLNAVIGLLIKYNDNHLYFDSNRFLNEKNYNSTLVQYQKIQKDICFENMNQTLSFIYSFLLDKSYIFKKIDLIMNIQNMSNHEKMCFLISYEEYKNQNRLS